MLTLIITLAAGIFLGMGALHGLYHAYDHFKTKARKRIKNRTNEELDERFFVLEDQMCSMNGKLEKLLKRRKKKKSTKLDGVPAEFH